MRDLYEVLGVPRNASQDDIKKAYRKLARKLHPDANPGDASAEERFKEITAANETLSDPERRKAYDEFGAMGRGAGPGQGFDPRAFQEYAQGAGFDLGDIFGNLFTRGRGRESQRRPERGPDIETSVRLSFADSLEGVQVTIPVELPATCPECSGSGAEPGTFPRTCPDCEGRGVRSRNQGIFSLSEPCPRCHGTGRVIEHPCHTCHGSGSVARTKRYSVRIPAGVRDGATVRLPRRGLPGANGGDNGDLHVRVSVDPSPIFTRRDDDFVVDVPITFAEAALGGEVDVPTPSGERVRVKVKAGSVDGTNLRVRGRGAPRADGKGAGDLLARLRLVVPKKLSRAQQDALRKFAALGEEDPREALYTGEAR